MAAPPCVDSALLTLLHVPADPQQKLVRGQMSPQMGQLHVQAGDDDQPAPKHPVDGVFRHRGAGQAADAEAHAGHVVELRADGAGAEDADLHLTAGPAEFLGDGLGQPEDIGLGGVIGERPPRRPRSGCGPCSGA